MNNIQQSQAVQRQHDPHRVDVTLYTWQLLVKVGVRLAYILPKVLLAFFFFDSDGHSHVLWHVRT